MWKQPCDWAPHGWNVKLGETTVLLVLPMAQCLDCDGKVRRPFFSFVLLFLLHHAQLPYRSTPMLCLCNILASESLQTLQLTFWLLVGVLRVAFCLKSIMLKKPGQSSRLMINLWPLAYWHTTMIVERLLHQPRSGVKWALYPCPLQIATTEYQHISALPRCLSFCCTQTFFLQQNHSVGNLLPYAVK